jgi:hypothetical protein
LIQELDRILEAQMNPLSSERPGPGATGFILETWGGMRLVALLDLGRKEEALASLSTLRVQAGESWSGVANVYQMMLRLEPPPDGGEPEAGERFHLTPRELAAFKKALAEPALPDPPRPTPGPMRLSMVGPHAAADWTRLQIDARFALWGPDELVWSPLRPEEVSALLAGRSPVIGARWVLHQGGQILATGEGMPRAEALDIALHGVKTSRLEQLDQFIKTHPERRDARRRRLDLLRPRLPDPRLEGRFLEDAEILLAPMGKLPVPPTGGAWARTARSLCAKLVRNLQVWPTDEHAWTAYVEWSGLDPAIPRPGTVLEGLAAWPYQWGNRHPGPIPDPISLQVLRTLAAEKRWEEILVWMDLVWRGGMETWLGARARRVNGAPSTMSPPRLKIFESQISATLALWGQALTQGGPPGKRGEVRAALEGIQTGLGKALDGPRR